MSSPATVARRPMAVLAAPDRLSPEILGAAGIAAALIALAAITAAVVALFAAAPARGWLGFGFGGIPNHPGEVASVLANNLRLLAGLLLATALAELVARSDARGAQGLHLRGLLLGCDVLVASLATFHAVLVGAAIGAYGDRALDSLLPHGPIELAGFSLGIAVYVGARRERCRIGRAVAVATIAVIGLAVAAVLEVYAS